MKIRSYSKQELAMLYFPDSDPRTATCHLMRWINRNASLHKELSATGYYRHSKFFTSRQVCAIVNYQYSVPTIYQRVSYTSIFE